MSEGQLPLPRSFQYQRLKQDEAVCDDAVGLIRGSRRRQRSKRVVVPLRRRIRLRIPRLRRFLRKKARQLRQGISRVVKRLKESQEHFGDLFAGNYLFMQVTPTALGLDKSRLPCPRT